MWYIFVAYFSQPMEIYRGTIINPLSSKKCEFFLDGGLVVSGGKIVDLGEFGKISKKYLQRARLSNSKRKNNRNDGVRIVVTGGIILPAFTDVHLHWVQNRVKGMFGGKLMTWLKDHIWPEEAKFNNKKYAEKMADEFYKELLKNGTKNAVIYSSVHKEATEIAIKKGLKHGNFIIGNVLMDTNSPANLQMNTGNEIKLVEYFAKKYGSKSAHGCKYAITPRFAPTCTMDLMKKVSAIAKKYDCFVQTHLSENLEELALVSRLFSEQKSYTGVYKKAGLLGRKTILGHCIHITDKEWKILKKSGAWVAHCPTSNTALNSGRMPVEKLLKYKIPYALATDIGASPHLSMIDVMREYVRVHQAQSLRELSPAPRITAVDALYRATLAGAQLMQIDKNHGNLSKGKAAEFVIIKNLVVGSSGKTGAGVKSAGVVARLSDVSAEATLRRVIKIPCEKIKLVLIS